MRVIATALVEQDDCLLLVQLARGPFAGFWLLPSATAEEDTVEATARRMVMERTGYPVSDQHLLSVVEEPKTGVLALRFVFCTQVGGRLAEGEDMEIAQARWFSRTAACEVLEERDVVPNLGVMSLIRAWVDDRQLSTLELLVEDACCPCYAYHNCCGWDAR